MAKSFSLVKYCQFFHAYIYIYTHTAPLYMYLNPCHIQPIPPFRRRLAASWSHSIP